MTAHPAGSTAPLNAAPLPVADELERKSVHLQVLDQNIDTSDATGRLLFNMLGAIAQFGTEILAERQMDGIRKAKARSVQFGQMIATRPKRAVWYFILLIYCEVSCVRYC